ncbi:MAG: hypothetical protein KF760_18240 [Candidatus Eremiobacteraeota bacterium]|nr:hypothetical protein [Candidatus Eremiobacteraeota bacterium]MCW5866736.1 hypothetical protein [Candidatus Eremiobacteraeota bacterium]
MIRWCLVLQLLWIPFLWSQYQVGQFNDDAAYLALARSLSQGLPYQNLFEMEAPAATRFPPGYPLALLPLQLFFPQQYWMPRILSCIFALAAVRVFSQEDKTAPWLLAANPFWALCGTMAMSEALFTLLTLLYLQRLQRPATRRQWLILGMAAALCYYVRAVGLALVPATLLWMRSRPPSHLAAYLLGFSLAAGPHLLLGAGYSSEFTGFEILLNLQTIPIHYGAVLLGLPGFDLSPLFLGLFLLALLGLVRRPELSLNASWTLCYLLVMVCWPYADPRFAIPILPCLLLGLCRLLPRPFLASLFFAQIALNLRLDPPQRIDLPAFPAAARVASTSMLPGLYLNLPSYTQPPIDLLEKEWEWDQELLDHHIDTILLHETEKELLPVFRARYRQLTPNLFAYRPHPRAILLHTAARRALQEKRYRSAQWLFTQALRHDPHKSTLHSGLAVALNELHQPEAAAQAARQALQLDPYNLEAL